jgi:hypothetical protein
MSFAIIVNGVSTPISKDFVEYSKTMKEYFESFPDTTSFEVPVDTQLHPIAIPMSSEFVDIHAKLTEEDEKAILEDIFKKYPDCKYPAPVRPNDFYIADLFMFYIRNPNLHGSEFPYESDISLLTKYVAPLALSEIASVIHSVQFFNIPPLEALLYKYCAKLINDAQDPVQTFAQLSHMTPKGQQPKVEEPKVEEPKVEEPKVEEHDTEEMEDEDEDEDDTEGEDEVDVDVD